MRAKQLLTVFVLLCFTLTALAQADTAKKSSTSPVRTGPKTFSEVITAKAQTTEGLITIHKLDDRYFFEIKNDLLGKDILLVSRLIQSAAEMRSQQTFLGFAGDQVNGSEIRFEKGPNNKVFIREMSYEEMSRDSTQPMFQSVQHSNLQSIIASFDVKAFSKNSDGVLIDVTDYLNGDNDLLYLNPNVKKILGMAAYQADKSYIESVNSYPNNTEIKTVKTYLKAAAPPNPNVPTGTYSVELNCSMILLPERPMQPRYFDPRVGYFSTAYTDFDADPQGVKRLQMVTRWKLEPKDGEWEKYFRGELVEPKKPIVYYIDPATPKKWVPYLVQGINDWQKAFEQAGFKNAIIGKPAPAKEEDSTWSLEDARYSAIVYKPSTIPNASGPNVHDPRTGEILESHINWYHNVMHLIHNWYMLQASPSDTNARKMEFDDALMGQLIRFVSSHEVGHTLGLLHNYGSSSTVSVDSLRNKTWVEANGHTPSIMDYARFNYVAQPEDHISQSGLFPRIGDYDKWAIEWGYTLLPGNPDAKQETGVLNQRVIEKLKNKRLWFGPESNPNDPRSQNEDIGDDAMKAGAYGIKNLQFVLSHLEEWTWTPNEGYSNLRDMYREVLDQFSRYMGHAAKNVGGIYETPKTVEQGGEIYSNVEKDKQKRAVAFICAQDFVTPTWILNQKILDKVGYNGLQIAGYLQNRQLDNLLSGAMIKKLISAEVTEGNQTYTAKDLFSDLHKAIWTELSSHTAIDTYRRNLQKEYVGHLESLMEAPPANAGPVKPADYTKTDVSSLARAELSRLHSEIKAALPLIKDDLSKYHLEDINDRIPQILEGKK